MARVGREGSRRRSVATMSRVGRDHGSRGRSVSLSSTTTINSEDGTKNEIVASRMPNDISGDDVPTTPCDIQNSSLNSAYPHKKEKHEEKNQSCLFPLSPLSSSIQQDEDDFLDPIPVLFSNGEEKKGDISHVSSDELSMREDQLQQQEQQSKTDIASFSCKSVDDNQFQLLINFLSANDELIKKYLFD